MLNLKEKKHLYPVTTSVSKEGYLYIGGCSTVELRNKFGTPLYIIDEETLTRNIKKYLSAFKENYTNFLLLYAAKAFANSAIFQLVNKLDLGLDVVSGGELHLALKSGFNKEKIYFHGNNKQISEIELAIEANIGKIVCDNLYELELIQLLSKKYNKTTNILIRLTPGIECHTHEYIKTGHLNSKFGLDLEYFKEVLNYIQTKGKNIALCGIHSHIGSQIFEIKPYLDTIEILLNEFHYAKKNFKIELNELNIGGGIGIAYTKEDDPFSIEEFVQKVTSKIKTTCKSLGLKLPLLVCEPGRSLISNAGITIYTVGSIKTIPGGIKYITIDGGMADNPRPITYQAKYTACIGNKMNATKSEKITIAGRYCESGDILIKNITLPKIETGDLLVVLNTGAYNYSMSSNYNMVPRPACVLVKDGNAEIIIERETYDDVIRKHKMLKRLTN